MNSQVKGLRRSRQNRIIAGVCGDKQFFGIAVLVRLGFLIVIWQVPGCWYIFLPGSSSVD
jgi:phage shock protein PspC (stress-responsive transcriptional regulator)